MFIKCPKLNDVNFGASTSKINAPPLATAGQEVSGSHSKNKQEIKTTSNQTKSNVKPILLTPEQIATQQVLWVNKMYAIHMANYWQS